jgi:hypothetical protein
MGVFSFSKSAALGALLLLHSTAQPLLAMAMPHAFSHFHRHPHPAVLGGERPKGLVSMVYFVNWVCFQKSVKRSVLLCPIFPFLWKAWLETALVGKGERKKKNG